MVPLNWPVSEPGDKHGAVVVGAAGAYPLTAWQGKLEDPLEKVWEATTRGWASVSPLVLPGWGWATAEHP